VGRLCALIVAVQVVGVFPLVAQRSERTDAAQPRPYTPPPHKRITAARIATGSIHLDGRLDDAAWGRAAWIADFVQKMPVEGAAPSDSMRLAILYDRNALYVGARMYSRDPAHIQAPLSRRDNTSQAEHLWVSFDTYHDRRTAYSFGVTASGVRMDWYHPEDNEYHLDGSFDPVWTAKAVIDSLGWTAEMRIPFSQLRFNDIPVQVWGFNADHWIPAHNEDVFWIPVPRNRTGWSSWMGELVGIAGIAPSRRIELLPYGAANATLTGRPDPADPFDDGTNLRAHGGADLKMGLGPNLTLDGTVNPDFGQVEADPAVVNLSAFEVFFDEKRPFFLEGNQLLRGGGPNYYYSRRIGAPPATEVTGDYVDLPASTTILGAGKVTGRLASGLSLGALAAVTARAYARTYDTASARFSRLEVAPPAAYGIVRLQQEFGRNASTVGATLTAVGRDLSHGGGLADVFDRQAYTGGVDAALRWDRGAYELRASAGFSRVQGDSTALQAIQTSPVHYFQRPDARHVDLDSSRAALNGYTAELRFGKNGGGHWLYDAGAQVQSPGLELNDLGRLSSADGRALYGSLRYRETQPGPLLQNYGIGVNASAEWDFGGVRQDASTEVEVDATFHNFWSVNASAEISYPTMDHNLTRGGPLMAVPRAWEARLRFGNSFGARTAWNGRLSYGADALGGQQYWVSGRLSLRPTERWELSVTPTYERQIDPRQYLTTLDSGGPATYGQRYLFGFVDRSTLSMQLRMSYTITPEMTVELYAEPFAASGRYYGIGELVAARTNDLLEYAADTTATPSLSRDSTGGYTLRDAGGYRRTIDNPDFNVWSFRSNLVLRWEWSAGSTLYLVWQQSRFAQDGRGRLVGPGELWDAVRAAGENFLAFKVTYWLSLH
jgi:Domain of unknown function (DUF5916)